MKKLIDFNVGYETVKRVITSLEEFESLKKEFPNSDFANLENYVNYRNPRRKNDDWIYKFDITKCKIAIEIESETDKAYRLQISHISGHNNGIPNSRHFKWVAKSLVTILDGQIYYPSWL